MTNQSTFFLPNQAGQGKSPVLVLHSNIFFCPCVVVPNPPQQKSYLDTCQCKVQDFEICHYKIHYLKYTTAKLAKLEICCSQRKYLSSLFVLPCHHVCLLTLPNPASSLLPLPPAPPPQLLALLPSSSRAAASTPESRCWLPLPSVSSSPSLPSAASLCAMERKAMAATSSHPHHYHRWPRFALAAATTKLEERRRASEEGELRRMRHMNGSRWRNSGQILRERRQPWMRERRKKARAL